ncbi:hypothetical protein RF11_15634 [Thelohanellus kitauei]|uniref:Uncharacterized protein n=1 Tax=Thelohanellus kitauei TaxID=669202 RepID=A0A0C2IGZ0_THEKT|nr:hypothetical protein RF11_15634 [Thelohanellus kitauei]
MASPAPPVNTKTSPKRVSSTDYLSPERNDLDSMIPLALQIFPYTSTKYSPARIVYGSEINLTVDFFTKGGYHEPHHDCEETPVKVKKIPEDLHYIFEKPTFQNRETVLVKNQNPTKVERLFEGPKELIKCFHPYCIRQPLLGERKIKNSTISYSFLPQENENFALRKDESANVPSWYSRIRKEVPRSHI